MTDSFSKSFRWGNAECRHFRVALGRLRHPCSHLGNLLSDWSILWMQGRQTAKQGGLSPRQPFLFVVTNIHVHMCLFHVGGGHPWNSGRRLQLWVQHSLSYWWHCFWYLNLCIHHHPCHVPVEADKHLRGKLLHYNVNPL